jgi:hypothetical protein
VALPARLTVFDSLLGGDRFMNEFSRWVSALAVGLPSNIFRRWPALLLLALAVTVQLGSPSLAGRKNAAAKARGDLNDEELIGPKSKRPYLYPQAEVLIRANEVREYAAECVLKGWYVEIVKFQISGYVRHAIADPERY